MSIGKVQRNTTNGKGKRNSGSRTVGKMPRNIDTTSPCCCKCSAAVCFGLCKCSFAVTFSSVVIPSSCVLMTAGGAGASWNSFKWVSGTPNGTFTAHIFPDGTDAFPCIQPNPGSTGYGDNGYAMNFSLWPSSSTCGGAIFNTRTGIAITIYCAQSRSFVPYIFAGLPLDSGDHAPYAVWFAGPILQDPTTHALYAIEEGTSAGAAQSAPSPNASQPFKIGSGGRADITLL